MLSNSYFKSVCRKVMEPFFIASCRLFQFVVMVSNWDRFVILLWRNTHILKKRPLFLCAVTLLPTVYHLHVLFKHMNSHLDIVTTVSYGPEQPHWCQNSRNVILRTAFCDAKKLEVFYTPDVDISRKVMAHLRRGASTSNVSKRGHIGNYMLAPRAIHARTHTFRLAQLLI